LKDIKNDLQKKELQAEEFHDLRKMLKSMMNLYFFRLAVEENEQNQRIFQYLLQLNKDMGDIHDELVMQDNRGEIDYEDYKLTLPRSIREKILAVLNRIQ
jgi:CHAD domain-containing protein